MQYSWKLRSQKLQVNKCNLLVYAWKLLPAYILHELIGRAVKSRWVAEVTDLKQ
jgi:hypothetical protein